MTGWREFNYHLDSPDFDVNKYMTVVRKERDLSQLVEADVEISKGPKTALKPVHKRQM